MLKLHIDSFDPSAFILKSIAIYPMTFSLPYHGVTELLSKSILSPMAFIKKKLCFTIGKPKPQYLHAVITGCEFLPAEDGHYRYRLKFSSPLRGLQYSQHKRVFQQQSLTQIAKTLLQKWPITDLHFDLPAIKIAHQMQYQETDLHCLSRLLADQQCWYTLQQSQKSIKLYLSDDLPTRNHVHQLSCQEKSDLLFDQPMLYQIQKKRALQYNLASITIAGKQASLLTIKTNTTGLQLGDYLNLTDHPQKKYNQCYRIVALRFNYRLRDGLHNWQQTLTLTEIQEKLHPRKRFKKSFMHILPAKVINWPNTNSTLNHKNYYLLQFPFEKKTPHPPGEGVPTLQPYADNGQRNYGIHCTLAAQTQVAVGFLQGDFSQPFILGVIPGKTQPGPSNHKNPQQNILQTPAGNCLKIDDGSHPAITLGNIIHKNYLQLSAADNSKKITLHNQSGNISIAAAKEMVMTTVGNFSLQCQRQIVNSQSMQIITQQGDINLSAAKDIQLTAKEAIRWQSHKDINFKWQENFHIKAQDDFSMLASKEFKITSAHGKITLNSGQTVYLQAKEKLHAGPLSLINGSLNINAKAITLAAGVINIFGLNPVA